MRLIFTTFLFALLTVTVGSSQLAPGSIGPNFIVDDLEGNEHVLYDYLDDGKIVIMDLYATWCGPCWSYHQQHILEDFYKEFGPDGTNEVMVLGVEADGSTNIDCIYGPTGCNSSTLGDWTEGISYPMIDNRAIAVDYQLSYYPTIYMIYPDRTVVETRQSSREEFIDFMSEGPVLSAGINPVFTESELTDGSFCQTEIDIDPSFTLQNLGEETITQADVMMMINGEVAYEAQWTGDIGPFQVIDDIDIPSFRVDDNAVLEFQFANINGDENSMLSHSSEVVLNSTNQVTITVNTDDSSVADGNFYVIRDENNNTIANVSLAENNATITTEHILPEAGCYTFIIFDNGVNGIAGGITISDEQGHQIYTNKGFFGSDIAFFNVAYMTNSVDLSNEVALTVSPNPASESLFLNFSENDMDFNIQLIDISGNSLINEKYIAGSLSHEIDVTQLPAGMYMLSMTNEQGYLTRRVIID